MCVVLFWLRVLLYWCDQCVVVVMSWVIVVLVIIVMHCDYDVVVCVVIVCDEVEWCACDVS